jgi:hypothetical protein
VEGGGEEEEEYIKVVGAKTRRKDAARKAKT